MESERELVEQNECSHPVGDFNATFEIQLIESPPMAAGNFLVKFRVTCGHCGRALSVIDEGQVLTYLETVMFR